MRPLVRQAAAIGAANTVLLKPNQRGTLSETLQAWQAARSLGYAGIVSARSGETEDTTIVHLALAWQVGQLKVGSFARGERMAKWNEAVAHRRAAGFACAIRRRGRVRAQPRRESATLTPACAGTRAFPALISRSFKSSRVMVDMPDLE